MKLWPVGRVAPYRFHDLRHTTASLLMMYGASPVAVQRILRHSDIRTTTEIYGHLAPEYLQNEIDRLSFRPQPLPDDEPVEKRVAASVSADPAPELPRFGSPVVPEASDKQLSPGTTCRKRSGFRTLTSVGAAGFEPTTSCSQSKRATNCATPRSPAGMAEGRRY